MENKMTKYWLPEYREALAEIINTFMILKNEDWAVSHHWLGLKCITVAKSKAQFYIAFSQNSFSISWVCFFFSPKYFEYSDEY